MATNNSNYCPQHPEMRADEVFVGNTRKGVPDYLHELSTARVGKVAYDIDGNVLPTSLGILPLFIGKSEFSRYDRIMMARLSTVGRHPFKPA